MQFDPDQFLEDIVQIPSDENVEEVRTYIADTLENHNINHRIDGNGNLIAHQGQGSPHTVLNTHMDTVSPHIPFSREGGTVHGRGACDAGGSLTTMMIAFLNTSPEEGTVTLALTPDEETLSKGADSLDFDADHYIVGEPTGLDICNASKGRFQGTVKIQGRSSHAAEPEEGVNTIEHVCSVTNALETYDETERAPDTHPELGSATLTPTMIEGGEATNRVPAELEIIVDRRSVPPETSKEFEDNLNSHLRESVAEEVDIEFSLAERETGFLEAFETDEEEQIVKELEAASDSSIRPFSAVAEASYFADNAPTVIFGPGQLTDEEGAVAHSEREYVSVKEVKKAARILEETLENIQQQNTNHKKVAQIVD